MSELIGQGHLQKMVVQLSDPVNYSMSLSKTSYPLNHYLGRTLHMRFTGHIACVNCARPIKKTFQQGYCFPCFRALAACDSCIIKPELCHYHLGTCREPQWGESHCFQPHIIYLANTSGVKVGITRHSQVPIRWIDQGATTALAIAAVTTRLQSGLVENLLRQQLNDKTNWRAMLKGEGEAVDLLAVRDKCWQRLENEFSDLASEQFARKDLTFLSKELVQINYPVQQYPEKITSINLDKTASWQGVLQGIKGQYLLTDQGVINCRKYSGYEIELSIT